MRHFVNDQVEARGIERVLNIQPVEDDWPLLPALPGLHHTLVVHQPDVILPLIIDDERCRVDQHFVEAIQPFDTQLQHRQAEEQGDACAFKRIQFEAL